MYHIYLAREDGSFELTGWTPSARLAALIAGVPGVFVMGW